MNIFDNEINFNKLFPFYFIIDNNLIVCEAGTSLLKLFPNIIGNNFKNIFKYKRPWNTQYTFESIIEFSQQLFILENEEKKLRLRTQVINLENSKKILFIGSPWIVSSDEMQNHGLILNDFALHDTLPDIFQYLKVAEINNNDIRILANELSEQKNLLQQVIDLIPHKIYLKDLNHRYILVNKQAEDFFENKSQVIIGKTYQEIYGIDQSECDNYLTDLEVINSKEKIEFICEFDNNITGEKTINRVIKLPYLVNGTLTGVLEIAVDITDNIETINKLNESEEKYRTIVENASDIIYQTTNTGKFIFLNKSAELITGYKNEELLNMSYLDLIRIDFKPVAKMYYMSKEFQKNISNSFYEIPLITKSGNEVWINQKVIPILKNGKIFGFQGVARDVTQLKKLELERIRTGEELKETASRLKSLVENLNTGVIVEDENRKILAVNDHFCKIFNIPVAPSEMIGWDCSNAAEQSKTLFKEPELFVKRIEEILNNKTIVMDEEIEMANGIVLERDFRPIFLKNKYKGHLWSYKDVTKRKLEEKELVKAKELAEASSIEKEQFLSTMSHEIRTPMNAVIGMTQLLISKEPKEDQIDYLKAIKFSADNLLGLINDILDYTKLESGKVLIENLDFDLHDLIHKIQNIFKFQAEEKGLRFNVHLDHDVNQFLKGDTVRLNQILTNLVGNALKFTEYGRVEILIYNTNIKNKNKFITFEVRDTGIGIESNKLDKIFERFTQANSDTTRKYGGTGLGLTITQLIVELLGGTIKVESKVGFGTSFYVTLHFEKGNKENIEGNTQKQKELEVKISGKKILLVEDNKLNQVIAIEFLKSWGLDSVKAENGQEAINYLNSNNDIDLVLMDLQMPIMDGYTATSYIRNNFNGKYNSLPIIALSASNSLEVINRAIACGVNDYLTKPFEQHALYKKVSDFLSIKPNKKEITESKTQTTTVYNLSYYEQFSNGNQDFIKEMINVYLEETPLILKTLDENVSKKEYMEIAATSHKLKTSFTMMGVNAKDVKLLEELAISKSSNFKTIKTLNNQIQAIGKSSINELQVFLNNS